LGVVGGRLPQEGLQGISRQVVEVEAVEKLHGQGQLESLRVEELLDDVEQLLRVLPLEN
jgi:hypothetical protein